MLLFKMAAYLSIPLNSFPSPCRHPCPAISKMAACPRWLPTKDAVIPDGSLSQHPPHPLTTPHVPIPTPRYPRWLPVHDGCPWRKLFIQDGDPSKMTTSRPAHPRWLPVKDGCWYTDKKEKKIFLIYVLGNSDGSCCKVIYEEGLLNM